MKCDVIVSVAMTTYNGERYVVKQLESIYNQTMKPDEVFICDDGSKDNTVHLINDFINSHHLDNWKVMVNNPNLGWKENFFKVTGLVNGDIIFFSDQDDIWNEDKIEMMSTLMIKHQMGALYANKIIIDSESHLMSGRQESTFFSGKLSKIELNPSFCSIKTLGCCMCINREVAEIYQRVGFYEDDHDSQCGRLALLFTSLWYLDKPVIRYRIHEGNSSGISAVASYGQSNRINRIKEIELNIKWIGRVMDTLSLNEDMKILLCKSRSFLTKRLGFFQGKVSFFYLLFKIQYYTGISMLIGDFAYKYEFNKFAGKIMWMLKK